MRPFRQKHLPPLLLLFTLWLLFFWQLLTPVMVDRVSLKQGDFSGQFVAFATYQYERMSRLEIPLWNPYNNGGLPFIADSQAAVFYPPRLLSILLAKVSDSWGYHTLELEMALHVLGYTVAMYALVHQLGAFALGRPILRRDSGLWGYLSGYPPLQLAVLRSRGVVSAGDLVPACCHPTQWVAPILDRMGWGGVGHVVVSRTPPEPAWFLTYIAVAYLGFRHWHPPAPIHQRPRTMLGAVALLGIITLGTTAITFLPAAEYLLHTARAGMGFAERGMVSRYKTFCKSSSPKW
ncbi:MAG UNVERIFIED_CONTAM: hypothetical protein LVT10_15415 [Anaerolineae bacterium]|jgi:hypothetical protein